MLGFIKKYFFTGLAFLSTLASVNSLSTAWLNAVPLSCISMNNHECKVRLQNVNVNGDDPVLFPISIKKVNAGVIATKSIIHMQNCVFLALWKTLTLKCSI